jgi:hypothetical protein
MTWQPVRIGAADYIRTERPTKIRFPDASGDWMEVSQPLIVGDTLQGRTIIRRVSDGARTVVAIRRPLTALVPLEARRINRIQTTIAVGAVSGLLLGAVLCVTRVACSASANAVPTN